MSKASSAPSKPSERPSPAEKPSTPNHGMSLDNKLKKRFVYKSPTFDDIWNMTCALREKCNDFKPVVGIVCGSGLGKVVEREDFTGKIIVPFEQIKGIPITTVPGHQGNFVFGKFNGRRVMALQGRVHSYEGYTTLQRAVPIRMMFLMGVKTVVLSSAIGGLNDAYKVGDFLLVKDHLFLPGWAGDSPLMGPNDERFGPRFLPLGNCYDKKMRDAAKEVATDLDITLHEGVLGMDPGPQFETPAECRALKTLGCDGIGMSVCHEAITARHCGMKVLAISMITNKCGLDSDVDPDKVEDIHDDVLKIGAKKSAEFCKLIAKILETLDL